MKKQIGYIGLGKMGFSMATRLLEKEYEIVAYDPNPEAVKELAEKGAKGVQDLSGVVSSLSSPRLVWLMIPHAAVDEVLRELLPLLREGDTVIDGGNSPYKESMRRNAELAEKGVFFLDAGISGGPSGARSGACVMVGGDKKRYDDFESLFSDISAPEAYGYVGGSGAGHFVKMVHNGIEYGMMQSIAEGFSVLKRSEFAISLKEVSRIYNKKSVIESRLVEWLHSAFEEYGEDLNSVSGEVSATGEGAWTVETAKTLKVDVPVIEESVRFRERSKDHPSYAGKILSALRHQFGGHEAGKKT